MARGIKVAPSTGNVFRDLRFSAAEAARLLIRADLCIEIEKIVKARRLTNGKLAKVLCISRQRLQHLRRGHLRRFSTDTLIDMLSLLDREVRLVVRRPTRASLPGDRARSKAIGKLRRLRRSIPPDFAFSRDVANQR